MILKQSEKIKQSRFKFIDIKRNKYSKNASILFVENNKILEVNRSIPFIRTNKEFKFKYFYIEEFLFVQDNKQYLYLKRLEYKKIKNNYEAEYYYDCIFIDKNKLIYLINNKANQYFETKDLKNYHKMKNKIIEIDVYKNIDKLYNEDITNAYFYDSKNVFFNKKLIFNNLYRLQKNELIEDKITLLDILDKSLLFKNYIVEELNLLSFFKTKNSIYDILHALKYPAFENTWFKFDNALLCDIYLLQLLFPNEYQDKKTIEEIKSLYKKVTPVQLKERSLLFRKKINSFLMDSYISKNESYHMDSYSMFLLFENEDHLESRLKKMDISLNKKRKFLFKPYQVEYKNNLYTLSINEIKEMLKEKLIDYALFEKFLHEDSFIKTEEMLQNLIRNLYTINIYFKNKEYNEEEYFMLYKFMNKRFGKISTLIDKSNELYHFITNKKEYNQKLFVSDYISYIEHDKYYIKQPETVLELKVIGEQMSNCVFSFRDVLIKDNDEGSSLFLVYEKDEDKPVVCIELHKEEETINCLEVKGYKNKLIDKEYENFVIEFLKKNNVNNLTKDIVL